MGKARRPIKPSNLYQINLSQYYFTGVELCFVGCFPVKLVHVKAAVKRRVRKVVVLSPCRHNYTLEYSPIVVAFFYVCAGVTL